MMLVGCCSGCKVSPKASEPRPVFDRDIGKLEVDIIQQYGSPKKIVVKQAKELVGELRSPLRVKVANENTEIKELYFRTVKGERILWLTKDPTGKWKVISDVFIPDGLLL